MVRKRYIAVELRRSVCTVAFPGLFCRYVQH